ncbi:SHOCT domain-containing protein [Halobacteriaceae archaeon GCM10025711]
MNELLLQMGSGMSGSWGFAFVGPFIGLLVMGAIVVGLWSIVSGSNHRSDGSDALETLRNQYARGEISDEEFEERSRRLRER